MAKSTGREPGYPLDDNPTPAPTMGDFAGSPPRNTMTVFQRLTQQAIGAKKEFGDSFDPARHQWPLLWHWMTSTEAGEAHVKEPAKLSLRASPGGFFASLSDDSFGVSIDASSEHLGGVFDAIEKALAQPQPAIRSWPNHEVKVKKKREVK